MKNFAFAASFVGALGLVACGGGGSGDDDVSFEPDASDNGGGDDAGVDGAECNPMTQQGCKSGEKCTWKVENPDMGLGRTACVPDGSVEAGGACTSAFQSDDGVDDCVAGYYCLSGECTEICNASPDSCDTDFACGTFVDLFDDISGSDIGLCNATCDPVDQTRDSDGAELCGSPDTSDPIKGCYGFPGNAYTCSPSGDPELTHNETIATSETFINSCAPGHLPLFYEPGSDQSQVLCMALCRPQETHSEAQDGAQGDPASDFTCANNDRVSVGDQDGAECRYTWWLEEPSDGFQEPQNLGFCINHAQFDYDSDDDGEADSPWPSCTTLSNTDTDGNDTPDHVEWGCGPLPEQQSSSQAARSKSPFRLAIPKAEALKQLEAWRQNR